PGFREAPADVARSLLGLARPFGDHVVNAFRDALRASSDGCVAQPIFGVACDGDGRRRVKLYLQFRDDAGDAPALLAARLLASPDDPRMDAPAELDFALPASDVSWSEIAELAPLARFRAAAAPFASLESQFAIGVRRISIPVGELDKLNVYYTLRDRDPALA